jgi:hypothetical protein
MPCTTQDPFTVLFLLAQVANVPKLCGSSYCNRKPSCTAESCPWQPSRFWDGGQMGPGILTSFAGLLVFILIVVVCLKWGGWEIEGFEMGNLSRLLLVKNKILRADGCEWVEWVWSRHTNLRSSLSLKHVQVGSPKPALWSSLFLYQNSA